MRILKSLKGGSCKGGSLQTAGGQARIAPTTTPEYSVARRKMVEEQLRLGGIIDPKVLALMEALPRHWFVDEALAPQAYQDSPLNIGYGQTISQPFTVALLAQALQLKGHENVLEIGTGCGYQTAVLAGLARQVYSIERLSPLLMKARVILRRLQIKNVILKYGDGSKGWPEKGPFQAIVAAAVSPAIPTPLLRQLEDGGRLVVPVEREGKQLLLCVRREGDAFRETVLRECRFVKMIGRHAFTDEKGFGSNPPISRTAAVRGRLHPALPVEGATRAPMIEPKQGFRRKVSEPKTIQERVPGISPNPLRGFRRLRHPQV